MNSNFQQYVTYTVQDFKQITELRLAWGRAVLELLRLELCAVRIEALAARLRKSAQLNKAKWLKNPVLKDQVKA